MLSENNYNAALNIQRKMYAALSELRDLTTELSSVANTRDEISMRMFLSMRQEQINLLKEYEKISDKQCRELKGQDGEDLKQILKTGTADLPQAQALAQQVKRNKDLLFRLQEQDRQISKRIAGPKSIYKD